MSDSHHYRPVPAGEIFLKGVLVHNPVLVQLIGICPIAAAAVSLRAGALLAAVSSLIIISTHVAASAFLKNIIRWVRVAVYLLIGLAFIAPAGWLLEQYQPDLRRTLGIYLPLLAANSLIALRCEKVAVRSSVKHSLLDSFAVSIGYSAVIVLTGFIRELLGSGEILEKPVRFLPAAPGLLLPFGGFLVLGFMAAALKGIVMRHFPKYAKAMGVEISPTAVTMKLKPDEDNTLPEAEPGHVLPLPAPPEHTFEPPVDKPGTQEETPELAGTDDSSAEEPAQSEETGTAQDNPPETGSADENEPVEPAAEVPKNPDAKEQADTLSHAPEPPPGEAAPAAMSADAAPAQLPQAPADDNDFDFKLKELFDYLNELEKETKDKQGE